VGELYGRAARVVIQELEITGLDVRFRVQRALRDEPDTLELTIYNLNNRHRSELQAFGAGLPVRLEAGYRPKQLTVGAAAALDAIGVASSLPLIFGGDLREVSSAREGPDWVTTLTAGDGDTAQKKRVNKGFGPGTPLRFAIEQVASELGLGLGQLPKEIANAALWDGGRQFPGGIVLSGNGFRQLTRLLTAAGYTWTVQDGEIVVVRAGASFGTAVLLTSETGLVGSPVPANDGRISAQCLLQPDLVPGRQVEFGARHVKGHYLVETAAYVGETAGQDWYVQFEASAI
jgi:hypothetical protein